MMKHVSSIATAFCRVVETVQANPFGGLVVVVLAALCVVGVWTAKH